MHIPIAIRSILNDTFKCVICQESPMKPPVIFAKCCKSILGCQSCVDTWYQGEEMQTRTCPKCRGDRAYVETCKLNGLDEFLEALRRNSNQCVEVLAVCAHQYTCIYHVVYMYIPCYYLPSVGNLRHSILDVIMILCTSWHSVASFIYWIELLKKIITVDQR